MTLRGRVEDRAYRIGRRIAVGGMGEVYEAETQESTRKVAVKRMLHAETLGDLKSLFLREVAVAAALEHPNVVEVIDAGQSGSDLYLVMEFVDGPSLSEVLRHLQEQQKPLPISVACGIMAQICRGLAHAHERALPDGTSLGIIHRDVAPENVLLQHTGLPKIVDFGLATLTGHQISTPGTIRGRIRCLSPEQARGEEVDARSDIFALGALMFELVSGDQLYPDEGVASLLWKVVAGKYEPIEDRLKNVDGDLVEIISTALAADPDGRFRSARELERKLDRFRAARGIRVDADLIAGVVRPLWPRIKEDRREKMEGTRGAIEGITLVLPADRANDEGSRTASPSKRTSELPLPSTPPESVVREPRPRTAPGGSGAPRSREAGLVPDRMSQSGEGQEVREPRSTETPTPGREFSRASSLSHDPAGSLSERIVRNEMAWLLLAGVFVLAACAAFLGVWRQEP